MIGAYFISQTPVITMKWEKKEENVLRRPPLYEEGGEKSVQGSPWK